MLKSKINLFFILFLFIFNVIDSSSLYSQDKEKEYSLIRLQSAIDELNQDLQSEQHKLSLSTNEERSKAINSSIQEISSRLESLTRNFKEIATSTDLTPIFQSKPSQNMDLSSEAKDLLSPLLNEVKRITTRPREIDRLRNEIGFLQENLQLIEKALVNLNEFSLTTKTPALTEQLKNITKELESKKQNTLTMLSTTAQRLQQREKERVSIAESLGQVLQIFFRSRGKNLACAALAAFIFWFVFRWFFGTIFARLILYKGKTFSLRFVYILYHLFASFGSAAVFLVVLYFFGDWVLLIFGLLLALGVIWASKQAIPKFCNQLTVMLNMGAVREGERVIYNGIPWLIKSINFFSILENPALKGGHIKLPINDLLDLRSRKSFEDEPWFATKEGDWVILSDGTIGEVVLQSIECVKLVSLGGTTKLFKTSDFIDATPIILSNGFRISISFGLDYIHQAIILTEIPNKLYESLKEELANQGFEDYINNINVEFEEAKASSLNIAVQVDFVGEAARSYEKLKRLINRICVETSNRYKWIIPYNKLTIEIEKNTTRGVKSI